MSTLIVMTPPRDPAVPQQEWQLPELPFLLVDKSGRTARAGRAALPLLPRAAATVLMIAARDLLTVAAAVPPLKGARLRQALPNVVEDLLIQDPQHCHLALDPQPLADGRRCVVAIDRAWMRFLVDAFAGAGHRNVRAVPLARCLPQPEPLGAPGMARATPLENGIEPIDAAADAAATDANAVTIGAPMAASIVACVLGPAMPTGVRLTDLAPAVETGAEAGALPVPATSASAPVELVVLRGAASVEGLAVPAAHVASTVDALAGDVRVAAYVLTGLPGEPALAGGALSGALPGAQPFAFEALARNALACRFNLCQFEFENNPLKLDGMVLRQLRVPVALAAAAVVVAIVGANLQWLMLVRQRDALDAQLTEVLLNTFPKTTVVLDPAAQMTRQLQQLRGAAGQTSPDDFLALAAGFARSLGPVPSNGIAVLDYRDRHLEVTFKPEVNADPALAQRLARNGLTGTVDPQTGKWQIRSAS